MSQSSNQDFKTAAQQAAARSSSRERGGGQESARPVQALASWLERGSTVLYFGFKKILVFYVVWVINCQIW
jgi:hypothetical protein